MKSVGPLESEFAAPIPEQLKTTAMHLFEDSGEPYGPPDPLREIHCCGPNLFWHVFQFLGPQIVDYLGLISESQKHHPREYNLFES